MGGTLCNQQCVEKKILQINVFKRQEDSKNFKHLAFEEVLSLTIPLTYFLYSKLRSFMFYFIDF